MWIETSSDADCDDEQLRGLRKHGYEAFHQDSFPKACCSGSPALRRRSTACEASSCDLGPFPDNPFSNVSPGPRCADAADSGPIPTETTIPPGSEPLSGDAATLAAFYNATDGPNWSDNTNWLTDAPISDWSGVTASNIVNGGAVGECVVRRLYISFDRLSGEIPAELANLAHLQYLNLKGNQLSGMIPIELGKIPNLRSLNLSDNQLSGEIPAELGNLPNLFLLFLQGNQLSGAIPIELGKIPSLSLDGNQLSGRIRRPNGTNPQYAWDGSTIRVSWDPVDGADYYKIYHDDFFDSSCSLTMGGSPSVCEELAANVVGTSYLHENPNASENYYWVVACNSDGCSEIDSRNPAAPIEPIPAGPANVTYAVEGAAIRVTWEAVPGADYYKVFHDDFFDDNCSLSRDGSPRFCEELAANVVPTTFVHTSPAATDNYYWVVACNTGGCSDIDSKKPAKPIETRPNGPAATPSSTGGAGELAQERAAELLAGELGVAVAGLKVVSTTAMTWSDASLGCPQPDMGYAQVVTPGYLVLFRDSEGTEYKVHTNEDGSSVTVCDK